MTQGRDVPRRAPILGLELLGKPSYRAASADTPLVTVAVAAFNGLGSIERALRSLEVQTCTDFEVVISDDGSSDGTFAVCAEFVNRNSNWRLVSNRGAKGMVGNYRYLLTQARGEYVTLLDQDDRREPRFIEAAIEGIGRVTSAIGWVSAVSVVWTDDRESVDHQVMHNNYAPRGLGSHCPSVRLATLLRRYVDIWLYGVYRTADFRRAFAVAPSTPIFPAVVLAKLALAGPIEVSSEVLIEYTAKGRVRRTIAEQDLERIGSQPRARTRRIPYVVRQAQSQIVVALKSRKLSLIDRLVGVTAISWDFFASAGARIGYRLATRIDTDPVWHYADVLAEMLHPHDHIVFAKDPLATGYLARDWRAH